MIKALAAWKPKAPVCWRFILCMRHVVCIRSAVRAGIAQWYRAGLQAG
jgi:hypothetical protein